MASPRSRYSDLMGWVSIFMLESFPVAMIIGCLLGFLAGLGIGGGSLLILWLTAVLGMAHTAARGINLLFFLPSALIACLFRGKQGYIDGKRILPAILAGCAAAGVFSYFSTLLELELIKKLFGGLLLLTGLRELMYKPKKM